LKCLASAGLPYIVAVEVLLGQSNDQKQDSVVPAIRINIIIASVMLLTAAALAQILAPRDFGLRGLPLTA